MSGQSDRDRRLNDDYLARFTRSLDQYDKLAAAHTAYVFCLDPADYPVHKRSAAWMVAGAEIRRIYHASKRLDPKGYFR